jgi:hypothetical protein
VAAVSPVVPELRIYRRALPVGTSRAAAATLARRLAALPGVEYAEVDAARHPQIQASDPLLDREWGLAAIGWERVDLPPGAALPRIGIVDSGLDRTHPQWRRAANVVAEIDLVDQDDVADDPAFGHGTIVTGIIAAPTDDIGIAGVAPAAPLVLARAIDSQGNLSCSSSAAGITFAARNGARVINLSYTGVDACRTEALAIRRAQGAGSVVVAAAGNRPERGLPPEFPAAYPHVVSVGAATREGRAAPFTRRSPKVDAIAPGVDVLSTVPRGADLDGTSDGYTLSTGTSMSAAWMSGALAVLMAARPGITGYEAVSTMLATARPGGPAARAGSGFVNLVAAARAAVPRLDRPEIDDGWPWRSNGHLRTASRRLGDSFLARVDRLRDPVDRFGVYLRRGERLLVRAAVTGRLRIRVRIIAPNRRRVLASAGPALRPLRLAIRARGRGPYVVEVTATRAWGRYRLTSRQLP